MLFEIESTSNATLLELWVAVLPFSVPPFVGAPLVSSSSLATSKASAEINARTVPLPSRKPVNIRGAVFLLYSLRFLDDILAYLFFLDFGTAAATDEITLSPPPTPTMSLLLYGSFLNGLGLPTHSCNGVPN